MTPMNGTTATTTVGLRSSAFPALATYPFTVTTVTRRTTRAGGDDPSPEGPEGEPVGEDEGGEKDPGPQPAPAPGAGVPVAPEPATPDANPIDPRVF